MSSTGDEWCVGEHVDIAMDKQNTASRTRKGPGERGG
jgi:hypothetical protein